jgi:hypothetical protein
LASCALVGSSGLVQNAIITLITTPFGYTQKEGHLFGFVNCLAGAPGGVIAAIFLYKRRERIKQVSLFIIAAAAVALAVFHIGFTNSAPFDQEEVPLEMVSLIANGLFISTLGTYAFEYAKELAPDVSEELSAGAIVFFVNVLALAQVSTVGYVYELHDGQFDESWYKKQVISYLMNIQYGSLLVGLACISFIRSNDDK